MTEKELRAKVVSIAEKYLRCKESNGSHRKIIDLYNSHKPLARGYPVKYLRQMDNFTIFGSNKRKLRKLLEDIKKWLAEIGMKIKGNWQIFRVGFTPKVERAHQALPKKKQRHRRPRLPSALGYRFGHGYTILRKHNLFRLKQSLHLYYYRRDRNRVISFKRASGLISRLGQLRKCNHQQVLDRHYQPKTMFALKKVVRKECRRLQALYPPYQAA